MQWPEGAGWVAVVASGAFGAYADYVRLMYSQIEKPAVLRSSVQACTYDLAWLVVVIGATLLIWHYGGTSHAIGALAGKWAFHQIAVHKARCQALRRWSAELVPMARGIATEELESGEGGHFDGNSDMYGTAYGAQMKAHIQSMLTRSGVAVPVDEAPFEMHVRVVARRLAEDQVKRNFTFKL